MSPLPARPKPRSQPAWGSPFWGSKQRADDEQTLCRATKFSVKVREWFASEVQQTRALVGGVLCRVLTLLRRTALAEVGQDFCWPRRGRKNLGVIQSSYQNSQFWRHTARHFQFESVALFRSPLGTWGAALSNEHDSA